jgi:hypothetical protein
MKKRRWHTWCLRGAAILCILYLLLLIPDAAPPVPSESAARPFIWNKDAYWSLLENGFVHARLIGCNGLDTQIAADVAAVDTMVAAVQTTSLPPTAPLFATIEDRFFKLGVLLGACPDRLMDYVRIFSALRKEIKNQSTHWDMNSEAARVCLYRLLYGGRIAVEEVMLQSPRELVPEVVMEVAEPSVTPSALVLGVKIHSGDVLVSRGGAPTSALIARGNDYPGNFSHAALAYVDSATGAVSIIESHIEKGVAIASVEDYLRDTKLRVMVLRLRSDLSCMQMDPMLPHRAAAYALGRARSEHIPYDFAMDTEESSKLFCSEVVSNAYRHVGVRLWTALSHISSPGVISWLSAFGVRYFVTEEPSDLEYDPQLRVVAEWRDAETLYKDHIDNAVVEVMLEGADRGDKLEYDWYLLPVARLIKAYCMIINQFDKIGPIPEGMNATAALRNKWFSRKHEAITQKLLLLASQFKEKNGYVPPYWALIKLAREAVASCYQTSEAANADL